MKYIVPLAIGVSLAAAVPSFAQTSAEGLYYSGFLQAEYYDYDGGTENALYGNALYSARLGWKF